MASLLQSSSSFAEVSERDLGQFYSNRSAYVISYDKLKEMAGKLKIKEMEYIEFLDTFTKSMSILYLPSIVKDFVILRPVEFINQLSTLFKIPYGKEDFNGVYTMEQLSQNKELANVIADILSSLGMALKTTSDKVDKRISALSGQPSTLLYIPLARSGRILEKSFSTSLYIIFDSKLTLPNFLSFFASELLKLRGFSLLTSGDDHKCHPNVLRVLLITSLGHEYIFFFVFHSIHIEVVIDSYREFGLSNVLEKILFCCQEALSKISSIVTKFSFKLALQCLRPDQVHTSKKIFEELSKKQLCHQCETTVSVVRRKWKETIQKIHEDEETRKGRSK
ncbi:PREDICTED: uncharacterized protein LOC109589883 [Amphimedon queenslandica]|uniref:Uncharacterized protein n=1 Tax=Amphimedon queenslandica TaxID=400682 RepID=A0AAN0JWX7_AMPQE|nr:PREDICTED: uncharacterized protein LOC109589883 [Amphimedon queenslandica]|eukprot:XP_019861426.1 PREDICTED: uncharacterized protein LOC109589883 [Amphimedon queenslandica]